jgi:hypothetical protein
LAIPGLIAKLILAGVITKNNDDLAFTEEFGKHVYSYAIANPVKIGSVSGWQDILVRFNLRLSRLCTNEVAAVPVLLDYHLHNVSAG